MIEIGQKVRVRTNVTVASEGIGGHVATVKRAEPASLRHPEGPMTYLVVFDDPADQGWEHWLSDTWLNDYEIELADAEPTKGDCDGSN